MYNKSILNEIRDRISVVAFIGERIPLKRAGRNFKGLCPFHNEKTPSFNVSDEKQIYHCFGCGEGGDIFSFVMKFDGIGFAEAVRYLAGIAGVELPRDESPVDRAKEDVREKRKRMCLRINEIARDFFHAQLMDDQKGAPARKYLQLRGISGENITQHFLGFADNSWESLSRHLDAKGVPLDLAGELGLVKSKDGGGHYDFFRNRLMFPIISHRGDVLGFGGRTLGGEKGDKGDDVAKYMNSPDSLVYHKSSCVYGLNRAAGEIRNEDAVILVEGYMDLIALNQAGIMNVVAPLGTALTEGHVKLIGRYTRNMLLVFDGDEAGSKAAVRSLQLFIELGTMPRVVVLPEGDDPDTFVRRQGGEEFRSLIKNATSLFEFFVDRTVQRTGLDAAGKVAAVSKIAPMLKLMSNPVERSVYGRAAAARIGVEEGDMAKAVGGAVQQTAQIIARASLKGASTADANFSAERMLVKTMLCHPKTIRGVFEKIEPATFKDDWCRTVANVLFGEAKKGEDIGIGDVLDGIEDVELSSGMRAMAIGENGCEETDVEDLVNDCVKKLRGRPRLERLNAINDDIRRAETSGDEKRLFELLREKRELTSQKTN